MGVDRSVGRLGWWRLSAHLIHHLAEVDSNSEKLTGEVVL
jgi:hypothetical protein